MWLGEGQKDWIFWLGDIQQKGKIQFFGLFYQPLPFWRRMYPNFWISRTPIPISFLLREWGGYPAMINQSHLFHIFVTTNKTSNNKKYLIWNLRTCHLLSFLKKCWWYMLYINKVIKLSSTWNEENVTTSQAINKRKCKIYKTIEFFTCFHYFILFWGTIFWHSIAEKYFMIWFSLECSLM